MKKTLLVLIFILTGITLLHIFGYLKIGVNYLSGISKIYNGKELDNKKEKELLASIQKEKEYNLKLKEFDSKVNSFYNYYFKKDDCSKYIKDYKDYNSPNNKGLNVDFLSIQKGNDELNDLIKCNIFNSLFDEIYIRIPYEYTLKKTSTLKIKKFILNYQKKGYKMHLIYIIQEKDIDEKVNVFNFINNKNIKSLSLYYYGTNSFSKGYSKLKELENFYIINYGKYNIDFTVGMYNENTLFGFKRESISNKDYQNKKFFKEYQNSYFDENSIEDLKKELLEISNYITKNDYLLLNFSLNKENVDKIDWFTIYEYFENKNVSFSIPNSIILDESKNIKEEDFINNIKLEYSNILKEKDVLLILYKNKISYFEKINEN